MRNESTAIVERDGRWYIAYCSSGALPEVRSAAERMLG